MPADDEPDDLELFDRWCAGDQKAGNQLFQRHGESLFRFFEHKVDGEASDLMQETFLACVAGRDRFRRHSSFRTYLFAIARRKLFDHWRRRISRPETDDVAEMSVASLSTSVGTRLSNHRERAALLDALRRLPLDQQILIEMFYWEELDREELAEVFEVEPATIGSRLFRARAALNQTLGAPSGVDGEPPGHLDDWARSLGRDPPSEDE
jgi:RNA polymerase sigma-70 factor (ECF subfamily)